MFNNVLKIKITFNPYGINGINYHKSTNVKSLRDYFVTATYNYKR